MTYLDYFLFVYLPYLCKVKLYRCKDTQYCVTYPNKTRNISRILFRKTSILLIMSEINIKDLRNNLGISQELLAKMIGVSPRTVQNWEAGSKIPNSKHAILRELTNKSVTVREPQMYYGGESPAIPVDTEEQYQRAIESGLKMLPEVDFVFSAGQASLVSSGHISRFWHLPDCEDCEAVAPMVGNSMLPTYPPGCELVFKRYTFDINKPNTIVFGNVFGVVLEDTITGEWHGHIKILRRHKDQELAKNYWIAHSINSDEFDDFDIEIKQVRGLWIVKKHMVTNVL